MKWTQHSTTQQHNEYRIKRHRLVARFKHSNLCSTVLNGNWNAIEMPNCTNVVLWPAAYSQLTPNFGWIECITSTHEARQRDTKMMKNIRKKKHQHTTKYNAHSFTHSSYSTHEVRMQKTLRRRCNRRRCYDAFSIWRIVLYFILSVWTCVAVWDQREISFHKWTDGFGMLLYAQKRRTVERERERNERMRESRIAGESKQMLFVTPLLCRRCICVHDSKVGFTKPHGKENGGEKINTQIRTKNTIFLVSNHVSTENSALYKH